MKITTIISFLVKPGKNNPKVGDSIGINLPLSGTLFSKLEEVFMKSEKECNIPIRFVISEDGLQENICRDMLKSFIKSPNINSAKPIANRLRDYTTQRSGLGLFFVIYGANRKRHRIVYSRFPAEQGILEEEIQNSLKIEFIEKIFMKNALSYKAALYEGESFDSEFWSGLVIDRQLNESNAQVADYWIRDFLSSDYKTTSKAGTRMLAIALRNASKTASLETKQEIVSTISLSKGFFGKTISISGFLNQLRLSENAIESIINELQNSKTAEDTFIFDKEEFQHNAAFAAVELDNESLLVAPADRFNECFTKELIDPKIEKYKFSTSGQIVDEQIRGRRP